MNATMTKSSSLKVTLGHLLALLLVIIFTLGACGRKGSLYMPEPKPIDSTASSQEDPESKKKEKRQSETQ